MLKTSVLAILACFAVTGQHALSTRDYFYVGGKDAGAAGKEVLSG